MSDLIWTKDYKCNRAELDYRFCLAFPGEILKVMVISKFDCMQQNRTDKCRLSIEVVVTALYICYPIIQFIVEFCINICARDNDNKVFFHRFIILQFFSLFLWDSKFATFWLRCSDIFRNKKFHKRLNSHGFTLTNKSENWNLM